MAVTVTMASMGMNPNRMLINVAWKKAAGKANIVITINPII